MKHDCQLAIEDATNRVNTTYTRALTAYKNRIVELNDLFINWKETEAQECRQLKITIPNSLTGIYQKVNSLGK